MNPSGSQFRRAPPRRVITLDTNSERPDVNQVAPSHGRGSRSATFRSTHSLLRSAVLLRSWEFLSEDYLNFLLVFVPFAIISGPLHWPGVIVFILNILALVPLSGLLDSALQTISAQACGVVGALFNIVLGDSVTLAVGFGSDNDCQRLNLLSQICIVALGRGDLALIQSIILGTILFNTLFILGWSFLIGGLRYREQRFNSTATNTMGSLMVLAATSYALPTFVPCAITARGSEASTTSPLVARAVAIVMLLIYLSFLFFQFGSHAILWEPLQHSDDEALYHHSDSHNRTRAMPSSSPLFVSSLLCITISLIATCSIPVVRSIPTVTTTLSTNHFFISLSLLPFAAYTPRLLSACRSAWHNKIDVATFVALGNSLQTAYVTMPLLIMLGWGLGQHLSLRFAWPETVLLLMAEVLVNYLICDGKSNYLEGAMCVGIYIITAIAVALFPSDGAAG